MASEIKGICDICGYEDRSDARSVVQECEDGIFRCKHCRQRAEFGRVLYAYNDEDLAMERGEYTPIKPIAESEMSLDAA